MIHQNRPCVSLVVRGPSFVYPPHKEDRRCAQIQRPTKRNCSFVEVPTTDCSQQPEDGEASLPKGKSSLSSTLIQERTRNRSSLKSMNPGRERKRAGRDRRSSFAKSPLGFSSGQTMPTESGRGFKRRRKKADSLFRKGRNDLARWGPPYGCRLLHGTRHPHRNVTQRGVGIAFIRHAGKWLQNGGACWCVCRRNPSILRFEHISGGDHASL